MGSGCSNASRASNKYNETEFIEGITINLGINQDHKSPGGTSESVQCSSMRVSTGREKY